MIRSKIMKLQWTTLRNQDKRYSNCWKGWFPFLTGESQQLMIGVQRPYNNKCITNTDFFFVQSIQIFYCFGHWLFLFKNTNIISSLINKGQRKLKILLITINIRYLKEKACCPCYKELLIYFYFFTSCTNVYKHK